MDQYQNLLYVYGYEFGTDSLSNRTVRGVGEKKKQLYHEYHLPKMEGHRWQQWEMANHLGRIQISTHAIQAADRPNDLSNTIHFDCRCSISNKLQVRNGFLTKTTIKGIAMIKVWCNKSTNYLFLSSASDKNDFRVRLLSSAEESSLSIRSLFLKYTLELKKKKKVCWSISQEGLLTMWDTTLYLSET